MSTVNFLEVLLYHRSACEGADDTLVELIDYCYRKFTKMIRLCEALGEGEFIMPDLKTQSAKEYLN